MATKIPAVLPGGFRDYLPIEMIARSKMLETIERVFRRFGFDPLKTPGMELESSLTGNDPDFGMQIYRSQLSRGRISPDSTAMRFDLTVPLARVIAANPDMPRPFKRYQMGDVWRGEKTQAGRFREFTQFDADTVGSASMLADAEIIALMVETMIALVGSEFTVRFNNRKILNGLPAFAGFDESLLTSVLKIIDKLPKIGREAVLRELGRPRRDQIELEDEGADQIEQSYGAGLSEYAVSQIGRFLELTGDTDSLLTQISNLFSEVEIARKGVAELREIVNALRAMCVPETNWCFDLSIARGLAYYTGPVFETFLNDLPSIGSVFSGGRYDGLVNRFMEGNIPAVGASVGVDRLFAALEKLDRLTKQRTVTQVLITMLDPTYEREYLAIAGDLRKSGISTTVWLGEDRTFKAQLAFAKRQEIPIVLILGDREVESGTVAVKDMRNRTQNVVPRDRLVETVRAIL